MENGKLNGKLNGDLNGGYPTKTSGYDNTGFNATEVEYENNVVTDFDETEEENDPWKVTKIEVDETPWSDLTCAGLIGRLIKYLFGITLILAFLYMFICSLDFLSSAFKLLGGKTAGRVFQQNEILNNPVAGLMIGVLVTVLVQSSSTSTSIIISMVGAGILNIQMSIPIIMGANIGTSVTNTIVAMGQITDKNDFRRAFAGATVHDMFNWITVIVFLPLEVITGYLRRLSGLVVHTFKDLEPDKSVNKDLLKVITKPFTKLIIEVDKGVITKIAKNEDATGSTLLKTCSDKVKPASCCDNVLGDLNILQNETTPLGTQVNTCNILNSCVEKDRCTDFFDDMGFNCDKFAVETGCCTAYTTANAIENNTMVDKEDFCAGLVNSCKNNFLVSKSCMSTWVNDTSFSCSDWVKTETECLSPKTHLFMGLVGKLDDVYIGIILLVISLAILCICLVCIVKLLHALLKGQIALIIKKFINADFPKCGFLTGYLAILLGAGLTILVQSSSIFTSTLTPLVGIGVIELDRMYPLTLGANIGTTTTGILSALAQDGEKIQDALQVAFCHLFFNISGILLLYPLPFFRPPIPMAKFLGNTTAKYRWFAIVYLFLMFLLLPAAVFGLSIPGWYVLAAVLIPIALIVIAILIVKLIQRKRPQWLPPKYRNWKWLPKPMRSLEPIDNAMQRYCCACVTKNKTDEDEKITVRTIRNEPLPVARVNSRPTDTRL